MGDIPAVGNAKIRTQQGADKRVFDGGVAALHEQGQPRLLGVVPWGIIGMKRKGVHHGRDDQVKVGRHAGKDAGLHRNGAGIRHGLQFRKQTHSFSTSSSSLRIMALVQAFRDEVWAGLRKGFAGWPFLPYSMILASMALLPPSERGSAKPTLMLWFPSLSTNGGVRPSERSSSPVERESYFVPLPITEERLLRTFAKTTSPPASRTRPAISSVLLPKRDSLRRNSSGISTFTLATWLHHLCHDLQIHPPALHVFHRGDLEAVAIAEERKVCGHGYTGNDPEAEQVGGFPKSRHVCPSLASVPSFPVCPDGGLGDLLFRFEALRIHGDFLFYQVNKGVHLSKGHTHTFHSRSSRRSRFTVCHTC
nr:MAG TPA: hypothetical protein [Caudoviricetes sp.]